MSEFHVTMYIHVRKSTGYKARIVKKKETVNKLPIYRLIAMNRLAFRTKVKVILS